MTDACQPKEASLPDLGLLSLPAPAQEVLATSSVVPSIPTRS